jgi:RNA polymerase sigma-70 factor (ECF subfamily)
MAATRRVDDSELLARLDSDIEAFETFYRRHVSRVSAYAARRCTSAADVADVVAQSFVRLFEVAHRFDPSRGAPLAFVFAITANVIRDHHRMLRRQRGLVQRLAGRDLLDADETERIEAAIDAARAAPEALDILRRAPEEQTAVLWMVADGASTAQAAQALGISPVAARVRLLRARRRARALLTPPLKEI